MERSDENLCFCEEQILRLGGCHFYSGLSLVVRCELRNALCDTCDSQAVADARITWWTRNHPECPTVADFTQMDADEKREARAKVSWQPERNPKDMRAWSDAERRNHDAKWEAFLQRKGWDTKKFGPRLVDTLREKGAA